MHCNGTANAMLSQSRHTGRQFRKRAVVTAGLNHSSTVYTAQCKFCKKMQCSLVWKEQACAFEQSAGCKCGMSCHWNGRQSEDTRSLLAFNCIHTLYITLHLFLVQILYTYTFCTLTLTALLHTLACTYTWCMHLAPHTPLTLAFITAYTKCITDVYTGIHLHLLASTWQAVRFTPPC